MYYWYPSLLPSINKYAANAQRKDAWRFLILRLFYNTALSSERRTGTSNRILERLDQITPFHHVEKGYHDYNHRNSCIFIT